MSLSGKRWGVRHWDFNILRLRGSCWGQQASIRLQVVGALWAVCIFFYRAPLVHLPQPWDAAVLTGIRWWQATNLGPWKINAKIFIIFIALNRRNSPSKGVVHKSVNTLRRQLAVAQPLPPGRQLYSKRTVKMHSGLVEQKECEGSRQLNDVVFQESDICTFSLDKSV